MRQHHITLHVDEAAPTEVIFDMMTRGAVPVYEHREPRVFPSVMKGKREVKVTDITERLRRPPVGELLIFNAVKEKDSWVLKCRMTLETPVPMAKVHVFYSFVDNDRNDPSQGKAFSSIERAVVYPV